MANPASQAWMDALGGNMSFKGADRSKYYTLPPPSTPGNGILDFINKLANESLLMPQTATAGWVNAFGAPPGTGQFANKSAPPPLNPAQMPPGTPIAPVISQQPRRTAVQGGGPQSFSLPLQQPSSYVDMVNGIEGTGQNTRSSSSGPGQFTDGTFKDYMRDKGLVLGQNGVPAEINAAKEVHGKDAISWYGAKNAQTLAAKNIPANDATLYGSHFLGAEGLSKVWSAAPNTPVTQLLSSDAISSNPEILAGKTAGEVKQWLEQKTSGNVLPSPPQVGVPPPKDLHPQLPSPPQAGAPSTLDFSTQNAFLDKAKPKQLDQAAYDQINIDKVLGGLAKGAGSVDATKAGSFASALAAAGAGGSEGKASADIARLEGQNAKDLQSQNYNLTRGQFAGQQLTAGHQVEKEQLATAFNNAKAIYDTNVANANLNYGVREENKKSAYDTGVINAQTKYEGDIKERQAKMPTVKADTNGITIQQFNPATNSVDVKFHPTKTIMEQAEGAEKLVKALGAPGPVAESMLVSHISTTIKDPVLAQAVLEKEAVKRTLQNGAGTAVFGKMYTEAYKQAELQVPATMMKDPVAYQQAIHDIAASNIYNALARSGNRAWLKPAAANGSIIAGVLGGGEPN